MSCLSDHSRSGVPTAPRKYLVVTMLAALTLQVVGYSTPRCSKLIEPSRQLVMTTSRLSPPTAAPPLLARLRCLPAVIPSPAISCSPSKDHGFPTTIRFPTFGRGAAVP